MPAPQDGSPVEDRRRYMRYPIAFRAIVHWSNHFAFVEVADIANGGLRLIGDYLPNLGGHVQIGARSLAVEGQVIWRTRDGCGIMLAQTIDALRVVRANCRLGLQQTIPDQPLAEVASSDVAGRAGFIFDNAESARAFLQAAGRH